MAGSIAHTGCRTTVAANMVVRPALFAAGAARHTEGRRAVPPGQERILDGHVGCGQRNTARNRALDHRSARERIGEDIDATCVVFLISSGHSRDENHSPPVTGVPPFSGLEDRVDFPFAHANTTAGCVSCRTGCTRGSGSISSSQKASTAGPRCNFHVPTRAYESFHVL